VGGVAGLDRSANATVTIQEAPLERWKYLNFGDLANSPAAADDANPDGDELTNMEEYFNASDPKSFTVRSELPSVSYFKGYLGMSFRRNLLATDLTYTVQVSDDLETWRDGSTFPGSDPSFDSPDTVTTSRILEGSGEWIGVGDREPSSAGRHFMRLKTVRH